MADIVGSVSKSSKTNVNTILGQELDKPIEVPYSWTEFASVEEMHKAGVTLSDAEVLDIVNGNRERNALSSARAKVVAEHSDKIKDTPEFKRAEFIKAARAFGMTQEQAEALASSKLQ